MSILGVIGTAGRGSDKNKMSQNLYFGMYKTLQHYMREIENIDTYVSGGAAWADHLAISLYKASVNLGESKKLRLHLPAQINKDGFYGNASATTANYYHKLFSEKTGANTLKTIFDLKSDPNVEIHCWNGFFERNNYVAQQADYLFAFTFGTKDYIPESYKSTGSPRDRVVSASVAGLKDGGTAHTWNSARGIKTHICLPLNKMVF